MLHARNRIFLYTERVKILFLLICLLIGLVMILRTDSVVGITGRFGWAERNLGGAGTYTFYKLLGIALILIGMFYAAGGVDAMVRSIAGIFTAPVPNN